MTLISGKFSYRFDAFLVDPVAWKLYERGQEVHLEPRVLKLLVYLISNRDRLVTRNELIESVWSDTVISDSALSKAVARLRKALNEDPSKPRYLETVHSKGYRFVASVEKVEPPDFGSARHGKLAMLNIRRHPLALAMFLLLLIPLALYWSRGSEQESPEPGEIASLAVLPLANLTGDPDQDFFADGLHEVLITELSQVSGLLVTSRQSTVRFKGSDMPLTEIASELKVDALVEGSMLRLGDGVEITIQLVDGRTDHHLWAQRYERDIRFVFDLLNNVAFTISEKIKSSDGSEAITPSVRTARSIDPAAAEAYLRGLNHLNQFSKDGIQRAIDSFQKAIEIEPDFAMAWGNLAAAQAMLALHGHAHPRAAIEEARLSAQTALATDGQFYIGHATLGWVRLFTREFQGACESFRRALQANPSDPYSLHGNADCLMLKGHMDQSVEQVRKAQLVDPFTAMHNRPLPFHLYVARRYDKAEAAALELQERIPVYSMHWLLALIYWQQGRLDEALDEQRREFEWHGEKLLSRVLDEGYEAGGAQGAMHAVADALVARSESEYVDSFRIAEAYSLAGSIDEAIYWLKQAVEHGSLESIYMTVRPDFDLLRTDPRFTQLVQQVGLDSIVKGEAMNNLENLRWKNRIILVYAPESLIGTAIANLETFASGIAERDIAWFVLGDGALRSNYEGVLAEDFGRNVMKTYFTPAPADTSVVLIGKDGLEKSRTRDLDLQQTFDLIDLMPMRVQEMQRP